MQAFIDERYEQHSRPQHFRRTVDRSLHLRAGCFTQLPFHFDRREAFLAPLASLEKGARTVGGQRRNTGGVFEGRERKGEEQRRMRIRMRNDDLSITASSSIDS